MGRRKRRPSVEGLRRVYNPDQAEDSYGTSGEVSTRAKRWDASKYD